MAKQASRSKRWFEAVSRAQDAISEMDDIANKLAEALTDLKEVQSEYEEWRDNLPENLTQSALGEKLDAVCDIDIESYVDEPMIDYQEACGVVGEAEAADLPLGFGRD